MVRTFAVLIAALVISGCQTSVRFFEPTKTTYERHITGTDQNGVGGVGRAAWLIKAGRVLDSLGGTCKPTQDASYTATASHKVSGYKKKHARRAETREELRFEEEIVVPCK